ncbi:MAG TPA: SPOR domain-containing protein [Terriglobales bacterium]|nr:SPOR domain-containing protein [Terriglobales bacterium]
MNLRQFSSFLAIIFSALFFLISPVKSQNLEQAIKFYDQGDYKDAKDELNSYLESNPSDYEALYYAGKLEGDAEKAAGYFKKVWGSSSQIKKEESGLELCLYYQAAGLDDSVLTISSKFKKTFPKSPLLPQILWLESKSLLATGKTEQALKGCRNIIDQYPSSSWAAWAQLGIADIYFSQGGFSRSIKEYTKIIDKYAGTEAFPLALAGMSRAFDATGDKDKAVLYMNLCKERYPGGIDSQSQVQAEEIIPRKDPGTAEKLTGTKYSVQIGVFANQENADKMMQKLKSQGYSPEQSSRTIQNKTYYVVRVGLFDSLSEAQKLREKLEREEGEVYRVVSN